MGYGLAEVFAERHTVSPLTREDADLTVRPAVFRIFDRIRPDLVIHSAAIPDLDTCEAEPARAFLVNVHGTRFVAEAAQAVGAAVAYISSDAVFSGLKNTPYTESDPPIPPTVYGRTKLRGEKIVAEMPGHYIFRVSVLFGPGKTNFIEKGLRQIEAGENYAVARDQLGGATYTLDAGRAIMSVVEARRFGLYHLANQGACTRYELARAAVELAGLEATKVIGKPASQMARRAVRLKYAVMEMRALREAGIALPRHWKEALANYVSRLRAGNAEAAPRLK